MSLPRTNGPLRAGYSLIELLVVIGIIAALIAILLPVVASVRRAARSTACLATLHQWGNAFQMYLADHRGRSFAFAAAPGGRVNPPLWWEHLEPYHPEVDQTLLCPEATEPANYQPVNAFQAWGPHNLWPEPGRTRMSYVGSYGVNGWLYQPAGGTGAGRPVTEPIRLPSGRASHIPVIFDSAYLQISPRDTDRSDFNPDDPIQHGYGWMRQAALRRHRRGVNMVFADGHADHVNVPDLWTLHWSEDFNPRTVVMPR